MTQAQKIVQALSANMGLFQEVYAEMSRHMAAQELESKCQVLHNWVYDNRIEHLPHWYLVNREAHAVASAYTPGNNEFWFRTIPLPDHSGYPTVDKVSGWAGVLEMLAQRFEERGYTLVEVENGFKPWE